MLVGALVAGCGGKSKSAGEHRHGRRRRKLTKVTLQLKWVTQAQFAGYYAAQGEGLTTRRGPRRDLKIGGPNITRSRSCSAGRREFGIDWLPSLLAARDKGTTSSTSRRCSRAAA